MASSRSGNYDKVLKCIEDVEKDLRCQKCLQRAVHPKTFIDCHHLFCQSCVNYKTCICYMCNVPSSAKEIYHDKYVENVTAYIMNIKNILRGNREAYSSEANDLPRLTNETIVSSKASTQAFGNTEHGTDSCGENPVGEGLPILVPEGDATTKGKPSNTRSKPGPKASRASCADLSAGLSDVVSPMSPSLNFNTQKEPSGMNSSLSIAKEKSSCSSSDELPKRKFSKQNLPLTSSGGKSSSSGDESKLSSDILNSPLQGKGLHLLESTPPRNVTHSTKKAANKRNTKGETPLHIACKKGIFSQVKTLIESGANPNVKENFGWTPLHEAVHYGRIDITKFLIEKGGAWVNTPGGENITCLHKAVALNLVEVVKLLLDWGANPKMVDVYGNIPLKYAIGDKVAEMLGNESKHHSARSLMASICDESDEEEDCVVFYCDGLSKNDHKLVLQLTSLIPGGKISNTLKSDVTHIVVYAENGICSRSFGVLHGILTGKKIVSLDWVNYSVEMKSVRHDHSSGVKSTKDYPFSNGITKARKCMKKLLPGLFSGMHLSLASTCRNVNYNGLKREDISVLVCAGGGQFLSREPDPEAIPNREKTVPFYTNNYVTELSGIEEEHPLKSCSHVILYQDEKESGPQRLNKSFLRYNMAHLKSLPIAWFVGCIESFTILDPSPFQ